MTRQLTINYFGAVQVRPDVFIIMENTEKARELSVNFAIYETKFREEIMIKLQRYNAAMLMAEWKDQCFNDVIKRLRETYARDEQVLFVLQLVESRYNAKF